MLKLSKSLVSRIELLLEPGNIVELENVDNDCRVSRHPREPEEIPLQPTLFCDDEDVYFVLAKKVGEDPVVVAQVLVPAGFWLTALKGARHPAPSSVNP